MAQICYNCPSCGGVWFRGYSWSACPTCEKRRRDERWERMKQIAKTIATIAAFVGCLLSSGVCGWILCDQHQWNRRGETRGEAEQRIERELNGRWAKRAFFTYQVHRVDRNYQSWQHRDVPHLVSSRGGAEYILIPPEE